jgi:hypothetical protein
VLGYVSKEDGCNAPLQDREGVTVLVVRGMARPPFHCNQPHTLGATAKRVSF